MKYIEANQKHKAGKISRTTSRSAEPAGLWESFPEDPGQVGGKLNLPPHWRGIFFFLKLLPPIFCFYTFCCRIASFFSILIVGRNFANQEILNVLFFLQNFVNSEFVFVKPTRQKAMMRKRRKKAATTAARMNPQMEIVSSAFTVYNWGLGGHQYGEQILWEQYCDTKWWWIGCWHLWCLTEWQDVFNIKFKFNRTSANKDLVIVACSPLLTLISL